MKSRIIIPEFAEKKELFKYLKENEETLIDNIKATKWNSEPCSFEFTKIGEKSDSSEKSNEPVSGNPDRLKVKVVANTCNWLDHDMDVLLNNSAKKTIEERQGQIPHIHDHSRKAESKIGEVEQILLQDISYAELGIKGTGSTQCIVFITEVIKSYNDKIFNQYKEGRANQHSIGLKYVQIDLAINDPDDPKYYDEWQKSIDLIINKEKALERGYFWAVKEIMLIENSIVLFGSNEKTPTLDNDLGKSVKPSVDTSKNQPDDSTDENDEPEFNFFL